MLRCYERSGIFLTLHESICSSSGGQCGNSCKAVRQRQRRERENGGQTSRKHRTILRNSDRLQTLVIWLAREFRNEKAPLFSVYVCRRLSAAEAAPWQQRASELCSARATIGLREIVRRRRRVDQRQRSTFPQLIQELFSFRLLYRPTHIEARDHTRWAYAMSKWLDTRSLPAERSEQH